MRKIRTRLVNFRVTEEEFERLEDRLGPARRPLPLRFRQIHHVRRHI